MIRSLACLDATQHPYHLPLLLSCNYPIVPFAFLSRANSGPKINSNSRWKRNKKKKKKKKRKRTRAQKGRDPHIITRFTPLWTSSHVRRGLKRVSHQIYYSSMIVVISAVKSWTLPRRNLQGPAGQLVRGRTVSSS